MSRGNYDNKIYPIEKIISALSYLTCGFAGFIWLLIGIFTKSSIRSFLKYHIFQSIFLAIGYFLLCQFVILVMQILSVIPFINVLVLRFSYYFNMPLFFGFSIIQVMVYTIIFYLVLTSLQGKYSYLPWISEIIKTNVRHG